MTNKLTILKGKVLNLRVVKVYRRQLIRANNKFFLLDAELVTISDFFHRNSHVFSEFRTFLSENQTFFSQR